MPPLNIGEAHITPSIPLLGLGERDFMSRVLVIDTNKRPVNPCRPAQARILLSQGKAAVFRMKPFTIILKEENHEKVDPLRIKIDPGSKKTGMVVMNDCTGEVLVAIELEHRGYAISKSLRSRAALRRSRRSRKTRYREPRFNNRTRKEGWLPPSVEHRILTTETLVRRLLRYCPIADISVEDAKFDTQLLDNPVLQNPEIAGVEYHPGGCHPSGCQQGELAGYEVREYLLEKFNRTCM